MKPTTTDTEAQALDSIERTCRWLGQFERAVAAQSLAKALRDGQISIVQLYGADSRVVMFGGRCLLG